MIAAHAVDASTWRDEARRLLAASVPPEEIDWTDGVQRSIFGGGSPPAAADAGGGPLRVPAAFVARAELACLHGAPDRFAVLYRLLWKIAHGARDVLSDPLDPDVARLTAMVRDVREEEHEMHAFVRFRRVVREDGEGWIAWYAPKHHVLERVAAYFAKRYPDTPWSLVTPTRAAFWDTQTLSFGPGAGRDVEPAPDELDALFDTYFASIFNPARVTKNRERVPEEAASRALIREAAGRVTRLTTPRVSASTLLLPPDRDLTHLAEAARSCRACPIGAHATQTVFGDGPRDARLMLIGEQPGDEEDVAGVPFVGPAGRLLDVLLSESGLDRAKLYVTNAVKHFKWEPRGKRRLHSRPNPVEVNACRGWLMAEIEAVKPSMIVALGATAGQSLCGSGFRVNRDRGKPTTTPWSPFFLATYHPSALLRAATPSDRNRMESEMRADLALARAELTRLESP